MLSGISRMELFSNRMNRIAKKESFTLTRNFQITGNKKFLIKNLTVSISYCLGNSHLNFEPTESFEFQENLRIASK